MTTGNEEEVLLTGLAARVRRLEDLEEIRALAVRSGFAVDNRDLDGERALFTDDAELRTMSGPGKGQGIDAITDYFRGRFASVGPTYHFTHGHLVDFRNDPDRARGVVASHAEVWRDGKPMITALRYHDRYERGRHGWQFRERVQAYMYFVDVRDYPEALGTTLRVRTSPDDWKPADWPKLG